MNDQRIVVVKLDKPIHGTGHHQFYYAAHYEADLQNRRGFGQTEREAILDLKGQK